MHAVLFSSVPDHDVKPEWVERARARMQSVSVFVCVGWDGVDCLAACRDVFVVWMLIV